MSTAILGEQRAEFLASLPFFLLAMVLIVIALFNSLRLPLVIWLTVPLSVIGVTAGLLSTNQPFGFMALLGFMSLSGMLIKNAIVLVDEIQFQQREGSPPFKSIIDSGLSRLPSGCDGCVDNGFGDDSVAGRCFLCRHGRDHYFRSCSGHRSDNARAAGVLLGLLPSEIRSVRVVRLVAQGPHL